MKKENNRTTFIIVSGIAILIVFVAIITINLLPNYESNSYYAKVDNDIEIKIEKIEYKNGKIFITTEGDPVAYCIKSTRSKPTNNALCWTKMSDNNASIPVIQSKKYYIWLKDKDGNISKYVSIK